MFRKPIIGLKAKILKSPNETEVGLEGIIIMETKNTISIDVDNKEKSVMKAGRLLAVNGEEVRGDDLLARPEERIKR